MLKVNDLIIVMLILWFILGRMVMADPLCYIKELALKEVNPHLFTMATLTGHVIRAYGTNYTVI